MCGIYGFTRTDIDLVLEMAKASVFRGPDRMRSYMDSKVSFAHNHLFIQSRTPTPQPFEDVNGNVLLWNGEIYGLEQSDTEWLANLLYHHGCSGLTHMNGMWSIAWYEKSKGLLHLVRDHFGTKPLFYTIIKGTLYFSSSLLSLKLIPDVSFEVDEEMVEIGKECGQFVPGPNTEYKHIKKVAPGHFLTWSIAERKFIRSGNIFPSRFTSTVQDRYDPGYLRFLYQQTLSEASISSQKTALLYSGGIDSSAILSILSQLGNIDLTAYNSICNAGDHRTRFMARMHAKPLVDDRYKEYDFTKTTREQRNDIPHFSNVYGPQIQDIFRTYPRLMLAKVVADDGCKVVLNGDGADELFVLKNVHPALLHRPIDVSSSIKFLHGIGKRNQYLLSWLPQQMFTTDHLNNDRLLDFFAYGEMYHAMSDSIAAYYSMESRPVFCHQKLTFHILNTPAKYKPCYVLDDWKTVWPDTKPKQLLTDPLKSELHLHHTSNALESKLGWALGNKRQRGVRSVNDQAYVDSVHAFAVK